MLKNETNSVMFGLFRKKFATFNKATLRQDEIGTGKQLAVPSTLSVSEVEMLI